MDGSFYFLDKLSTKINYSFRRQEMRGPISKVLWRIRRDPKAAIVASMALFLPSFAFSQVACSITNFTVVAFGHGGTYIHGTMNGAPASYVAICGTTAGNVDVIRKLQAASYP
jgi:hypothetical protein